MKSFLYLTSIVLTCATSNAALAQEAQPQTSEIEGAPPAPDAGEIIVTAQRRSERLQDVPIAITSLGSARLEAANVQTLQDLPRIAPTLRGGNGPGTSGVRLSIHGIGSLGNSAIEPSVATFLDGVYIARPGAMYGALLDLDAIEVLSGPQGTLFGRNASVGALNIRTKAPTDRFEGNLAAEIGTGDRYRLDGAVNLPLGEDVALRVAGLVQLFDGYWKTTGTGGRSGVDNYAVRGTLRARLSDSLT
ncbi:outer membrane receptor protein involved in Fe transport [Sphingopyxis panaciterrae]|uniref:TonB-dependent receptor plug domain-containing protein n=1 Tax=Sphingopyxis panaciterrae TaxID=363841 RepID=UPI0014209529|nr:TonB-dependent receptor plug domain-containing protein [Sphingopyxis panaciterrae]NIJ37477.1 outer membrane receptor protein involved in Fe transport [Sphingopyxis panaciterrae]